MTFKLDGISSCSSILKSSESGEEEDRFTLEDLGGLVLPTFFPSITCCLMSLRLPGSDLPLLSVNINGISDDFSCPKSVSDAEFQTGSSRLAI